MEDGSDDEIVSLVSAIERKCPDVKILWPAKSTKFVAGPSLTELMAEMAHCVRDIEQLAGQRAATRGSPPFGVTSAFPW
jgi:hypothetical protein